MLDIFVLVFASYFLSRLNLATSLKTNPIMIPSHIYEYGLPQQYDVFYAMGLAMIFQARKELL